MSNEQVHEIVIIKRVAGGHEDEHHGGVWKIAFADFMTAMMAFFLVMWLISANDKTKAIIARYFNPVQLVDSTSQPRGLEDPKPGAPSVMPRSGSSPPEAKSKDGKTPAGEAQPKAGQGTATEAGKAEATNENALFQDPYAVLAELAEKGKTPPAHPQPPPRPVPKSQSDGKLGGSGAIGTKGGESYRDPFEPAAAATADAADDPLSDPAGPQGTPPAGAATEADKPVEPSSSQPVTPAKAAEPAKPAAAQAIAPSPVAALRAEVQALVKSDGAAPGHAPTVEVQQSEEGLLVDVTDGSDFTMFSSASARPSPKTVVLMEKIGQLLKAQPGQIVLRGFTDSRPFKSDTYDNWRLSAARADMAHYMLARGGIDERRFERIEGYADRHPKNPTDPASPANRRIQILVRGAKP